LKTAGSYYIIVASFRSINIREYRRGNQKWTIQRNWQHKGTQDEEKQNKTKTQYVLNALVCKQTQIT